MEGCAQFPAGSVAAPRVLLLTFGCRAAQADEELLASALVSAGLVPVPGAKVDGARAAVVSGCVVTARAERDVRKALRRLRREHPGLVLVAAGCAARPPFSDCLATLGADIVFARDDPKGLALELAARLGADRRSGGLEAGRVARDPRDDPAPSVRRARVPLRIQDGCNGSCAFCVVPSVRGPARSVRAEEVLEGVARLAAEGVPEIVLTGIQTGAWGTDLSPPSTLADLLERILSSRPRPARLRLSSLEPEHLSQRLVEIVAGVPGFCPHLHVPIQSASPRLLAAMGRPDPSRAIAMLERSWRRHPDLAVGFDLIAGLPAESEEDFALTAGLVERLPLAYLHVFTYSPRPGTRALDVRPRVPERIAVLRTRALLRADVRLREAYRRGLFGRAAEVVVESIGGDGSARGTTERFVPAVVVGAAPAVRAVVPGTVEVLLPDGVLRVVPSPSS